MNIQFGAVTLLSFFPFLDNVLLQRGQAYTNYTSLLTYQPDPRLPAGLVAYQAPFKSFVWDSGVSGANILNSVSGSFGVLSRGQSGMVVDFVNGRVLLPSSVGTNAIVSGSYAFKDLNVYFANQTQEVMVFTNKYYLNSRFGITGLPPAYDFVTPCVFLTNANEINKPYALGGLYGTAFTISLNVLAENMNQLEGVLSLLVDQKDNNFPQLDPNIAYPLTNLGDYKASGFNYQAVLAQYGMPSNQYSIINCKASKVSDYAKIDEAIFLGIVDITVERVRTIR